MFGSLGFNEILFIMVLALLIFGPKRLPQIGRTMGKAIGEFRRASTDLKRSMEVEMTLAEERERATSTSEGPSAVAAAGAEPRGEGSELASAFEAVEESEGTDEQPDYGVPEPADVGAPDEVVPPDDPVPSDDPTGDSEPSRADDSTVRAFPAEEPRPTEGS